MTKRLQMPYTPINQVKKEAKTTTKKNKETKQIDVFLTNILLTSYIFKNFNNFKLKYKPEPDLEKEWDELTSNSDQDEDYICNQNKQTNNLLIDELSETSDSDVLKLSKKPISNK